VDSKTGHKSINNHEKTCLAHVRVPIGILWLRKVVLVRPPPRKKNIQKQQSSQTQHNKTKVGVGSNDQTTGGNCAA
jgi:hypothetical protein